MVKDAIAFKKLQKIYKDQKVFIIPSSYLDNIDDKFTKHKHDNNIWSKYDSVGRYIYRYDAESEPAFKKLIPYFLITNNERTKYYVAKNKETNKLELGQGKPIVQDIGSYQIILKALSNEIFRINVDPTSRAKFIGTIKDNDEEKNSFGLVFIFTAKENSVSINENTHENLWMSEEELIENYSKFDNWSKYIIDFIYSQIDRK